MGKRKRCPVCKILHLNSKSDLCKSCEIGLKQLEKISKRRGMECELGEIEYLEELLEAYKKFLVS